MLIGIKMKKSLAELGHNGHLKIYINPKKFTLTHVFQSISPKWLGIGIKMKKIVTELGHSDLLKIYINPSKIHVNPGI